MPIDVIQAYSTAEYGIVGLLLELLSSVRLTNRETNDLETKEVARSAIDGSYGRGSV